VIPVEESLLWDSLWDFDKNSPKSSWQLLGRAYCVQPNLYLNASTLCSTLDNRHFPIYLARKSVRAIKAYNEQQAEKKAQWSINVSTLEDLSGCHSKAVRNYLDSDEDRPNALTMGMTDKFVPP
jgi:hypothetical protein